MHETVHHILVVDDEPRHLRNLARMIRELRPMYSVLEASHGRGALELVEKSPVDIIITDIKMPIIDGLTLIEKINQTKKKIKVIILSGYAHFEYAQKAVRLGAFDFILKPVNEEKIDDLLKKVEQRIAFELSEENEKESIKKQLTSTVSAYKRHQLNRWINDEANELKNRDIEGIISCKNPGLVFVAEIDRNSDQPGADGSKADLLRKDFEALIESSVCSLGEPISFFFENNPDQMITMLSKNSIDPKGSDLSDKLSEMIKNVHEKYGINITIGIGNETGDLPEGFKRSFREARSALVLKFYNKDQKIIPFAPIHSAEKTCFIKSVDENRLVEALRVNERDKAANIMSEILDKIVSGDYPDPQKLKSVIINLLISVMQGLIPEDGLDELIRKSNQALGSCRSFDELAPAASKILADINAIHKNKNKKFDTIIQQCQKYIEENYTEDLSLDTMANLFSFNSSYFSSIFKKAFGVNFSEYLQKLRIAKSKELLKDKRNKVYEVAESVGYRDVKYFNRVFKKEVGISPDEYKRLEINAKG